MIWSYESASLSPPMVADPASNARHQHTRLRRRMLYGEWTEDLRARIRSRVGAVREAAWGEPDVSANPFRAVAEQVAVMYDDPPVLSHPLDPGGRAAGLLSEELDRAGVWSIMAGIQRDTVGMRECLGRVDIDEEDGRLLLRPVYADLVVPGPTPAADPNELASIREWRLRQEGGGIPFWTTDILDPATQTHRVESPTGEDLSGMLGAPASGAAYMYRLADGRPVLPYVLWHAKLRGRLWDPYEAREIVDGTLDVGVLWSFWHHCFRDASWPQRWTAGYTVAGAQAIGDDGAATTRTEVVTDPAVLAVLVPIAEGITGQVGQWGPGANPEELARAIMVYERRLPAYMGQNPSDFARVSGDPRSAYALMISRDGQREAARRLEPQFRRGDVRLVTLCAAALNRWSEARGTPLGLPEVGWRIRYKAIPPSSEELAAKRADVMERLDRGLISRVGAYRELNPGLSLAEARRELAEIDRERAMGTGNRPAVDPEPDPEDPEDPEPGDAGDLED